MINPHDDRGQSVWASIPPGGAVFLLRRLGAGKRVTGAEVRTEALARREAGMESAAVELEFTWRQLTQAARCVIDAAATSAIGSSEVDLAEVEPGLGSEQITTAEAAVLMGRSDRWIRSLIDQGHLEGTRVGRSWLVDRDQVVHLAEQRRVA